MRQSLIVGARPVYTKGKAFPRVPLESGQWRIEGENVDSSQIQLTIYTPTQANGGEYMMPKVAALPRAPEFFIVVGPAEVSAEIVTPGRESHVSVFAYPMGSNGNKHS